MPTNVDDIVRKLSPAQRDKVEARAAQLIAEEMTLRELRNAGQTHARPDGHEGSKLSSRPASFYN